MISGLIIDQIIAGRVQFRRRLGRLCHTIEYFVDQKNEGNQKAKPTPKSEF